MLSGARLQGNSAGPAPLWIALAILQVYVLLIVFLCSRARTKSPLRKRFATHEVKTEFWELVDCWGSGLLTCPYQVITERDWLSSSPSFKYKHNWVGISQGLDGDAESKVKLNDVLGIYLLWVNMLCARFLLCGKRFHSFHCNNLCSVRNIGGSTGRINMELVWGSS